MAIQALVKVTYCYVPDGAAQLSVPSAQSVAITLSPAGPSATTSNLTMPNGNTVTAGNLSTLNGLIADALDAYLTANPTVVTNMAAWPTGGV